MTQAQRTARTLQSAGIFAAVTKAPQSVNPGGCTYAVKLGAQNLARALETLRGQGLPIGRLFTLDGRGVFREAEL